MKLLLLLSLVFYLSCHKAKVDLLVVNANIYTVDKDFTIQEAMAIKDGKIVATGTSASVLKAFDGAEKIDAKGKYIYPGFIDAHAHFYRYALTLRTVNLVSTQSWDEVIIRVRSFAAEHPRGWITGRGWDQNDWKDKAFPSKERLDELFPSRPVLLTRIDGHAAIANQAALDLAGVKPGEKLEGGIIEVKNGKLTGLLVDNAVGRISSKIPEPQFSEVAEAIRQAELNCFAAGLTTVDDCGLDISEVLSLQSLHNTGDCRMRIFAMLSDRKANYDYIFKEGKIKTPRLNVSSVKVYADGALGSRGACLLQPYEDHPGNYGFLLSTKEHFDSVASLLFARNFQMCTHAIGDSGNRTILNIYAKYLKPGNNRRWRIEHAQVVDENDVAIFGKYNIIPSVQPTHATSDMYWAEERLGKRRIKTAYAYHRLLQQNRWLPLGTDFPVEDISPLKTFYAAVVRKDQKGYPENGYQPENALTRQEAIRGMTIWAAMANFEENEKGSLEKGKFADFVILDEDRMKAAEGDLPNIKVLQTYLDGKQVFAR